MVQAGRVNLNRHICFGLTILILTLSLSLSPRAPSLSLSLSLSLFLFLYLGDYRCSVTYVGKNHVLGGGVITATGTLA